MNWLLLAVTLLALAGPARAGAVEEFRAFTTQTRSARGDFSQVVVDRAGKVLREASGTFSLSRPGKFRWTYVKPYAQLLVGDGQKVWIYDTDLNQVTIRAMDQTLSATPAALLAGSQDFEKVFAVEDLPPADGLTWLGAKPRAAESGLESARIGFNKGTLEKLEFVDSFGQRTIITVSKFEKNPALGADHFKFTPPKGADVIGG
ncbi:MAG: outer membrane lipoprotein chaperone LolA [Betaproteobacteria bacterium]|nr:outer membrane lipoprotein chaperone LolA [Betaproteobacteria bacterium]